MGIPGSANPMLFGGAAAYQINQSLRFRGNSTYFTKTFGSSGNRRKFTLSVWVKKATVTAVNPNDTGLNFFSSNSGSVSDSMNVGMSASTEAIQFYQYNSGYTGGIYSFARYRDPSAWMHMVFVWDSDQTSSAADRMAVYVNNRIERPNGSESANTGPALNKDAAWNYSSYTHAIGGTYQTNHMYLAEAYHIDGQALDPSSFGETDPITGAWIPKKYSGSYTGNSFYLKFDPSATNGIGHDHSGLGNHWTPTGFSTSGTGTDVMSDTPTNNYCTWNPINKGPSAGSYGSQLSDGNLVLAYNRTAGDFYATSTFGLPTTGKWYWEQRLTSTGSIFAIMGIAELNWTWNVSPRVSYFSSGKIVTSPDGSSDAQTGLSTYTTGDVIGHAWDADAGTLQFYKNGTAVGNPQAPTTTSGITFAIAFNAGSDTGWTTVLNCGQRAFEQTPPTGYKALSTANLPEPTIKKGSKYFNTVTYTGNGTARSITTGHSSDFVWTKLRNGTQSHQLYDIVRGVNQRLQSDDTSAEAASANSLTQFNSDGFDLGTSAASNLNGYNYVAWSWDANGAGSSNTAGSITSTVSANATAGFSIVTYTGTGSNATVGHGLGVAPSFYVVKNRNTSDQSWYCYHKDLGASYYIYLNLTAAAGTGTAIWNGAPSSSVFTLGTSNAANGSTMTYVAYCFSEVAGYSKFGSYTGNGSTDGVFVHCGFRPRWIMVKTSSNAYGWAIFDTARQTYNEDETLLQPNTSSAEATNSAWGVDILSNGFKWRNGGEVFNYSGYTYIFAAFAELPFKYANAR